jgi:hypothetical protein
LAARARLAAHRGDFSHGLDLARQAVELFEWSGWVNDLPTAWLALAEVHRAAGRPGEAEAAVAEAVRVYEAKGNVAAAARLKVEAAR